LEVLVRDNNIDQALRVLKKKMQREGIFREMKMRRSYEKPSENGAAQKLRPSAAPANWRASALCARINRAHHLPLADNIYQWEWSH